MLTPLNTNANSFPLSLSPYQSRVATHMESGKNYSLLAFNPGYALQAAELNEIQELFFLNQNLTQRMNANWIKINSGQTTQFTAPYWEGLIPLNPDMVQITNLTSFVGTSLAFGLTIQQGWYLYTDKTSKLSFWIWNNNTLTTTTTATSSNVYFGLSVSTKYIDCCQTDDSCVDGDSTLRDASQSFYQEFTCGASRFQVNIGNEIYSYTTATPSSNTGFSLIFNASISPTINTISYPNNYTIASSI